MKPRRTLQNPRNLILTLLSVLLTLPYSLSSGGPYTALLVGLPALTVIHLVLGTAVFHDDPNEAVAKDREKAVTDLLQNPFFIFSKGAGGGAISTQDVQSSDEGRCIAFSWLTVAAVHLLNAVLIEDKLAYTGPMRLSRYWPVWLLCIALATWDIYKHLKKK